VTTTATALRWRVHRVTCELDARGEIDAHAAMCLHQGIAARRAAPLEMVLVDLRDLTAIGPDGLALLRAHNADCHAHGIELGLLISGHERHDQIAEAFVLAGLGDALRYAIEPRPPATTRPVRLLHQVHSVRRGASCQGRAARLATPPAPGRDDVSAITARPPRAMRRLASPARSPRSLRRW